MRNLNDKSIVFLAVFSAALIGGAGPVFAKIALTETSPVIFTFLRFLASSIILLPFLLKYPLKFNKNLIKLVAVSLFLTGNIFIFAYGIKLTTASISQILYVIAPIIIVGLSYFILKERISSQKAIGTLLGLIGAMIIVFLPILESSHSSGNLTGNLLIMLAITSFSLYSVFSKKLHINFSPINIVMVFSFTTLLIMSPLAFVEIITSKSPVFNLSTLAIFSILYVGIIMTVVHYILHQYAIKHGSPLAGSTILYLQPISTVIWAAVLLSEQLTKGIILGGLIAFLGTYFIIYASNKKENN